MTHTPGAPAHVRVETTTGTAESAADLARSAVERGLAACAQVEAPITSHYRWEGEVRADPEWRVAFKTARDRLGDLVDHLTAAHPYDVPEVIAVPIEGGSPEYLAWLVSETRR
ncbi:divalent-cation tolerance protein CutA [Streptomonospora sp. S1-112]|uniref:Divalent-cation tolerance protein CutA n=1 Tax=Streptomonospora mangrovi TaxID=2883123 RepID=A0A9X3SDD8_9ACTN|nr:divalent-cation tolerance protein CutA [Streptomonospora mangrovi]MDA0564703.1 divalent-cation tolerance protein CutA [Streptomonospora mangrovi]